MTATIEGMELKLVDTLHIDTLEIGDLIGWQDQVVEVTSLCSEDDEASWFTVKDEWGEEHLAVFLLDTMVPFYYYCEED
jgi:hypothetical protein